MYWIIHVARYGFLLEGYFCSSERACVRWMELELCLASVGNRMTPEANMTTARLEWRSENGYGMAKDESGEMIRKRKRSCGSVAEELIPAGNRPLGNPEHQFVK